MKDYIHEFGEDQAKKKLPVTFNPQDDWDFNQPIEHNPETPNINIVPPQQASGNDQIDMTAKEGYENQPVTYFDSKTRQNKPANWITKTRSNAQISKPNKGHVSFPAESITEKQLKEMVSTAVLHMMNAPTPEDFKLLDEQKNDIRQRIVNYQTRPGVMSISLREDLEKDEASVGILIDPTNTKNWVFMKEEVIYKLPYSYKDSLHNFAAEVWGNRIDENMGEEAGAEYIAQLKQQVAAAHKEANDRYNEVSHQSTGHSMGNIFEPSRTNYPDAQEGHRNALSDGQYMLLKKKAIDLETKLRRLEKRIKK